MCRLSNQTSKESSQCSESAVCAFSLGPKCGQIVDKTARKWSFVAAPLHFTDSQIQVIILFIVDTLLGTQVSPHYDTLHTGLVVGADKNAFNASLLKICISFELKLVFH